jgi:hypothetical protein
MAHIMEFGEVLEAVVNLPAEEQMELISIVRRRLIELERKRILADVRETRKDFAAGRCRTGPVAKLMKEIHS